MASRKEKLILDPYPLCFRVPTVKQMHLSIASNIWFVEHVTMNTAQLSGDYYDLNLNENTYRSFIYAFAYEIGVIDPSDYVSWQLEINAHMLCNYLVQNYIRLSVTEEDVINISKYFTYWFLSKKLRVERSQSLMANLYLEYEIR